MSDDLVRRLRDNCTCNFPDTPCGAEEECRNAFEGADRIEQLEAELVRTFNHMMADAKRVEKLEAALREIEYLDRPQVRGLPRRIEIYDIARKALEGKDD